MRFTSKPVFHKCTFKTFIKVTILGSEYGFLASIKQVIDYPEMWTWLLHGKLHSFYIKQNYIPVNLGVLSLFL